MPTLIPEWPQHSAIRVAVLRLACNRILSVAGADSRGLVHSEQVQAQPPAVPARLYRLRDRIQQKFKHLGGALPLSILN